MQYFIGFLIGVAVCAVAAHTYIQAVVNQELAAMTKALVEFRAAVEAKVTEIKSKL